MVRGRQKHAEIERSSETGGHLAEPHPQLACVLHSFPMYRARVPSGRRPRPVLRGAMTRFRILHHQQSFQRDAMRGRLYDPLAAEYLVCQFWLRAAGRRQMAPRRRGRLSGSVWELKAFQELSTLELDGVFATTPLL
jgi:hypothetical protein